MRETSNARTVLWAGIAMAAFALGIHVGSMSEARRAEECMDRCEADDLLPPDAPTLPCATMCLGGEP